MDREAGDAALATCAELYGQVERKLFAEVAAGRSAAPLKREYIREHGIPARLFNAVRVSLDGKVSAVRAAQRLRVDGLERRIAPESVSIGGFGLTRLALGTGRRETRHRTQQAPARPPRRNQSEGHASAASWAPVRSCCRPSILLSRLGAGRRCGVRRR